MDGTDKMVVYITRQLLGLVGLGGSELVSIQNKLIQFGAASVEIRQNVREIGDWMANILPPWAAYRVLMSGCLIGLNKCSGVWPVGVGETWQRLIAKCVLAMTGEEAKEACGIEKLCGGLEARIDVFFTWCVSYGRKHLRGGLGVSPN